MPETPDATPTVEPLPVRQPGTNRTPDPDSTPRPAFTFDWAAFGESTEQGEQ